MSAEAVLMAARALGVEGPALEAGETAGRPAPSDERALRAWLTEQVAARLRTHPALLLSHLYRVDVRERDVQAALAAPHPARALADALIAREVEKARYRAHYRPPPADDPAV